MGISRSYVKQWDKPQREGVCVYVQVRHLCVLSCSIETHHVRHWSHLVKLSLNSFTAKFFFLKIVIFNSMIGISVLRQTFLDLYQSNQHCGGGIPVF